jgi:hypothetical protein
VAAVALAAVAAGIVALAGGCLAGLPRVAFGVLAACWLYLAGLAGAGVAFSAAVRCSHGRWAGGALPVAESTAAFFPVAFILLAVILLAAPAWIPGAAAAPWADSAFRALRNLAATLLLFVAGTRFLHRARLEKDARPGAPAVVYLILYAATLSLWAVDLVMGLHDWAPSTVLPPFYFMSAFLAAIAWVALAAALWPAPERGGATRHDLGKLLLGFVVLWGYLLWSAYLPVWYGGLPDETGQLVARWAGGWKLVSLTAMATVLAFPFLFLVPERTKRGRLTLAVAAGSILAGLLATSLLLVLPSLEVRGDPLSILVGGGVAAGALGLFVLTVGARLAPVVAQTQLRVTGAEMPSVRNPSP